MRFFLYGLPLALVALIVAAFVNASLLSSHRKNEITTGLLGEPATLNPIREADASGGAVQDVIFNGLLKYDENIEIAPDLARSFSLSQTTTIFFTDSSAAMKALAVIFQARDQWPAWKLDHVEQVSNTLILTFSEPGMEMSSRIFSLLDPSSTLPVHTVRADVASRARDLLAAFHASPAASAIVREWFESDAAFELTVTGNPDGFVKSLTDFLASRPESKAQVAVAETGNFLAEPIVDFILRDNVRWHDGVPFSSRDVAFTYAAIMDDANASPRKPDFLYILRVETPDPLRVRVIYRKPYSPALSSWMIGQLPAHILEGRSPEWWAQYYNRSPIGTGPFKFQEWKTNEYLRVVRNPDYFEAPGPWLDAMIFRMLPDQLTMRLAFETHQVDDWGVDPWAVASFQHDPRFDVFSSPARGYNYVGWNLRRPLFQDERVRRALAHAVNIPDMIRYIIYGHGVQSTGIFTPGMWFFNPDVAPYTYDPAASRRLLAEAGWKPGPDGILVKDGRRFSFTLITSNSNEIRRDIATLVQDNLRSLGIEVKIELYEWAVFLKNFINKADFDAMVLGWQLGPDYDQYQIWHSSQNNPEQLNVVSYNNPRVDRLLADIRQEYNREKIISIAAEMQELIYRDQPYLFLYVPDRTAVIWKDSFRIRRPDGNGGWIDSPVEMTKAGWSYYLPWFYRPDYANLLPR